MVRSYLGDSLLSPEGCTKRAWRGTCACDVPWPTRGKLWAAQMAKIIWVQERPVWINAVFLPIQVCADPGSVALLILPSASWTVNCPTAPLLAVSVLQGHDCCALGLVSPWVGKNGSLTIDLSSCISVVPRKSGRAYLFNSV